MARALYSRGYADVRAEMIASAWFKRRSPRVRARMMCLNPTLPEGCKAKGWHPADTLAQHWGAGVMGKRKFLTRFGREAFEILAAQPGTIMKRGRRVYIAREAVEDQLYLRAA